MTQTNQPTETSARGNRKAKAVPTHVAKVARRSWGKKTTYDRIGVLFENDDGSLYLKLSGKQIIDSGIRLWKIEDKKDLAADEISLADEDADEEAGE